MSGRAGSLIRAGALWGAAVALVLAAHLGGGLWLLHRAEADSPPPGLPESVYVDLVPAEKAAEEPARPQSQPHPEPQSAPAAEPLELPPLPELEPLEDMARLFPPAPPVLQAPASAALTGSPRPERRPQRDPQTQARTRPQAPREPEGQRQAEPRQEQPAVPRPQQARRVEQGAAGTGASGPSPQQKASLMSQWGAQIRSCISRRASAPRGIREGGRVTLRLSVSRSGSIQGVGIVGSSGIAALDQAALQAARRAGRCPGAPAALTDASYAFDLPINLQIR